jgi:hypothetical protein
MKKIIVALIFLATVSQASLFLDQGVGVSGKQMGGANTAYPNDVSAIYWNMAAVAGKVNEFYVDYSASFLEINKATILYGYSEGNDSLFFGVYRVDAGEVVTMVTRNSVAVNVRYADTALMAGYSTKFIGDSNIGLTVKGIQQSFITNKSGYACDLSFYKKLNDLNLGLVFENIYLKDIEEKLNIRGGARYQLDKLTIAADLNYKELYSSTYWAIGINYRLIGGIYLKGGYNSYDSKLFLGTTFDMKSMRVDYVYYDSNLGATHQIGFTF